MIWCKFSNNVSAGNQVCVTRMPSSFLLTSLLVVSRPQVQVYPSKNLSVIHQLLPELLRKLYLHTITGTVANYNWCLLLHVAGVLIVKKKLLKNPVPSSCGGGSVFFVSYFWWNHLDEPWTLLLLGRVGLVLLSLSPQHWQHHFTAKRVRKQYRRFPHFAGASRRTSLPSRSRNEGGRRDTSHRGIYTCWTRLPAQGGCGVEGHHAKGAWVMQV